LYNIFKIKQLSDMCVIEYGVTVEYRLTLWLPGHFNVIAILCHFSYKLCSLKTCLC
jgi:hypothetical protein